MKAGLNERTTKGCGERSRNKNEMQARKGRKNRPKQKKEKMQKMKKERMIWLDNIQICKICNKYKSALMLVE